MGRTSKNGHASEMCSSGDAPSLTSVWTMCCIQVVPDLGYEQMKTSVGRSGSAAHDATVASDVIGSSGMGSSDII
eukprot:7382241-Prymnesium_polylepis.1